MFLTAPAPGTERCSEARPVTAVRSAYSAAGAACDTSQKVYVSARAPGARPEINCIIIAQKSLYLKSFKMCMHEIFF